MNTYSKWSDFKKDWYTIDDLAKFLKSKGYAAGVASIKRWEKWGIIPLPKRVQYRSLMWRVYDKDKKDFKVILDGLKESVKLRMRITKPPTELEL